MKKLIYIVILIGLVSCSVEERAIRKAQRMTSRDIRSGKIQFFPPEIVSDTLR
ncbi:MAG: hypothetical protein ACO23V_00575 [Chitinophagaceae bacterium]